MGRVAAFGGEDPGRDFDGLDVLGEGRGHHEDEALVLALLLGGAVGVERVSAPIDVADRRAGGARDFSRFPFQFLDRSEIDYRVKYVVETPGARDITTYSSSTILREQRSRARRRSACVLFATTWRCSMSHSFLLSR